MTTALASGHVRGINEPLLDKEVLLSIYGPRGGYRTCDAMSVDQANALAADLVRALIELGDYTLVDRIERATRGWDTCREDGGYRIVHGCVVHGRLYRDLYTAEQDLIQLRRDTIATALTGDNA